MNRTDGTFFKDDAPDAHDALLTKRFRQSGVVIFGNDRDNALTGALPCVTCRYDLKGLSIRSLCPECGTAVRATILYQVDPMADAFQPIRHPRVLAWGLVLWSASALVSALAVWGLRSADLIATQTFSSPHVPWLASLALWGVLLSWVGSLTMIRPLPSMNRWHSIGALLALDLHDGRALTPAPGDRVDGSNGGQSGGRAGGRAGG